MSPREPSSRPVAFAMMTATLVVGLFVLTRLGPGAPMTPLNAAVPGPSADRFDAERMERLLALRETTTQMLGAMAVEPYFEEDRTMEIRPTVIPPPRDPRQPNSPFNGYYGNSAAIRPTPRRSSPGEARSADDAPLGKSSSHSERNRNTPRSYRVKRDDTIMSIAVQELGGANRVKLLLDANPCLLSGPIEEHMELVIPAAG